MPKPVNLLRRWTHGWTRLLWLLPLGLGAADPIPPEPKSSKVDTQSLADLSFRELLDVRVDTVYTASRHTQHSWEAPASVSIVTRDEIQSFGYRSLADVLNSLPGLYTSNDRNYTYLGMRGFSRPGDYNSRVLVLVDGHRVNDNIYDSALIAQEGLVEIDSIERVEVIRGPSSSLYGSGAFFGTINVITRRAAQIHGVEVSGEGGSFDTYKGRASVGHKFQSGVELVLTGSYYDSQGQKRLYFPEFDQPENNSGVAQNLDYERAYHFQGSVSYRDFTFSAAANSRRKGVPTAPFGDIFNDPRVQTLDQAGYLDLKYEHDFENELRLTARVDVHGYKYGGVYPYDAANPGDPRFPVLNIDRALGAWWGTEVTATKTLFESLTLTGGTEFRNNFKQNQKNFDEGTPNTVLVDDRSHSTITSAFGQAEWAPLQNLNLSAGVRYDHYSNVGDTVNPRFGVMYKPWAPSTLKLLYGRAFRAPNSYELHYVAQTSVPNPNLKPETIETWEVVWEQQLHEKFKLSASGFNYNVHGLVSAVNNGGIFSYDNVDRVRAYGTEVSGESRWGHGWLASLSYTLQRSEDQATAEELTNYPKQMAKLHLRIPLVKERLFAGAELNYISSMRAVQSGRVSGYWLANITLFSRELVKGLEVSASLYNVFDRRYGVTGFDEHVQRILTQDGRSFRLKMTYHF